MLNATKERILEVLLYCAANGKAKTLSHFGIKNEDTLRRYMSQAKKDYNIDISVIGDIEKIKENFTGDEIKAIANGGRIVPGMSKVPIINFNGERIRIGALTDTHLGSSFTHPELVYKAFDEFKKEKVDFITHSGDVTEGMSNRAGHVYELSHIGYDVQKSHAIDVFRNWADTPIYMIDGNHDRWYIKSNGAIIVKDVCEALPNAEFLGHDEGDISLKGKAILKLWHGEDGNSYALSYRLQKIIESLTGGEKPHAMFAGHTHKSLYIFERHVHCYSIGSVQRQTKWMRGKRIPAHAGFWIIDLWVNDTGIFKTTGTWYPFYC